MTWIKLDDRAPRHPKINDLTDRAFRWWILALCYASEFLTDGDLPKAFYRQVPNKVRAELVDAGLWDFNDPDLCIHDYLGHQQSRETVENERRRQRDRRKGERGTTDRRTAGTTPGTTAGSSTEVPRPDTDTDTEKTREQTTPSASGGGGLILSPREFARLQETHAFVGSKLRVPNALHRELVGKSGANADAILRDWYAFLNEELEAKDKGTGDVFAWLRPRHQAFAVARGWVEAAPKPQLVRRDDAELDAKLLAAEAEIEAKKAKAGAR